MPALAPPEEVMDPMVAKQLEEELRVGSSSRVSLALKDLSYY